MLGLNLKPDAVEGCHCIEWMFWLGGDARLFLCLFQEQLNFIVSRDFYKFQFTRATNFKPLSSNYMVSDKFQMHAKLRRRFKLSHFAPNLTKDALPLTCREMTLVLNIF